MKTLMLMLSCAAAMGAQLEPPPRDGRPHPPPGERGPHAPPDGPHFRPPRPDHPGRPEGPGADSLFARLGPHEKQEMESFMREHFPRVMDLAERLRATNPPRYHRLMTRLTPEMQGLMDVMRVDPQRGALMIAERRLDGEIRLAARQVRAATSETEKAEARSRLTELIGQLFDVRHERRAQEIQQLEARVIELRARHEEAAQRREEAIQRMTDERLEPPDPLEWEDD